MTMSDVFWFSSFAGSGTQTSMTCASLGGCGYCAAYVNVKVLVAGPDAAADLPEGPGSGGLLITAEAFATAATRAATIAAASRRIDGRGRRRRVMGFRFSSESLPRPAGGCRGAGS